MVYLLFCLVIFPFSPMVKWWDGEIIPYGTVMMVRQLSCGDFSIINLLTEVVWVNFPQDFPRGVFPGTISRDIYLIRGSLGMQIFPGDVPGRDSTYVITAKHIWLVCMQMDAYVVICFSIYVLVRPRILSWNVLGETGSMWYYKKLLYWLKYHLVILAVNVDFLLSPQG